MITMSYEAFFAVIAICGTAGYILGRDINAKSNCPARQLL